jgi:hypothetical protein
VLSIGGMVVLEVNGHTQKKKPVPVLPQMSHELALDRTRASVVKAGV